LAFAIRERELIIDESRIMRSARATSVGTLRPSIVLYDEQHPLGDDIGDLQTYDLSRNPDLLLIMGTSLKVHGLKRVVKEFAKTVHARKDGLVVFVNATPPSKEWEGIIDVHIHGQTDVWAEKVEEDWKRLRPADWEIQTRLDGEVAVTAGTIKKEAKPKGVKKDVKVEREVKVKKETKPRVKAEVKPKIEKGAAKPRGMSVL
jgi:NAD-dependent histone deacetylase SIR2